jgi:hypothetical protein
MNRTRGHGCPYCAGNKVCPHNNLATSFPDLCYEWDHTRNLKSPHEYTYASNHQAHWICKINPCGCHEWQATIASRTCSGTGCPYCAHNNFCPHNNLSTINPNLALEWHPTKNERGPENYGPAVADMVWWKCLKSTCECHEWQASINSRSNGNGCPFCAGKQVCLHSNLAAKFPDLIFEWDHERNLQTPDTYPSRSNNMAHWICPKNLSHRYPAVIASRTGKIKSGCPICRESKGEKSIASILERRKIPYARQYILELLPRKKFDFYFIHDNMKWLVEYDGIQHFTPNPNFDRTLNTFEHRQDMDRIKTLIACHSNYRLIRIDHTNKDEASIEYQIQKAIDLNQPIYYSNPDLYTYISQATINIQTLQDLAPEFYQRITK